MNKIWYKVTFLALLVFFYLIPVVGFAQDPGDPGDPGFDPDAPIDGGIGWLIAAGVGYGVKRFRNVKKVNND